MTQFWECCCFTQPDLLKNARFRNVLDKVLRFCFVFTPIAFNWEGFVMVLMKAHLDFPQQQWRRHCALRVSLVSLVRRRIKVAYCYSNYYFISHQGNSWCHPLFWRNQCRMRLQCPFSEFRKKNFSISCLNNWLAPVKFLQASERRSWSQHEWSAPRCTIYANQRRIWLHLDLKRFPTARFHECIHCIFELISGYCLHALLTNSSYHLNPTCLAVSPVPGGIHETDIPDT